MLRLARRSPRAISIRSRIQSETRYSITATKVNQTTSKTFFRQNYKRRQQKRAAFSSTLVPSLVDSHPVLIDLDQVPRNIERGQPCCQRHRVLLSVSCTNSCLP